MADEDPNAPMPPVEGPYSLARRERLLDTILPPIAPPADSGELPRLIQMRRTILAELIEDAMEQLDGMDPDPDVEANGDELDSTLAEDDAGAGNHATTYEKTGAGCPVSDPDSASVPEWHTLGRHKNRQFTGSLPAEDAEDDDPDVGVEDSPLGFDPEEDMCLAGDDRVCSGAVMRMGICEDTGPGDADDAEREQMYGDVPTLPVVSLDADVFTDQRAHLGMSNLLSSFRTNGSEVKSADTGGRHRSVGWPDQPGAPV